MTKKDDTTPRERNVKRLGMIVSLVVDLASDLEPSEIASLMTPRPSSYLESIFRYPDASVPVRNALFKVLYDQRVADRTRSALSPPDETKTTSRRRRKPR